jgi:C1A family cysteine protease
MRTAFATALLAVASASELSSKFMQFITTHNKSYGTVEEFEFRKAIFAEMEDFIQSHNTSNDMTFNVAHNKFSDWTSAEYKRILGFKPSNTTETTTVFAETNASSVNWVEAGAVQAVRDQGQCGSCWAFSSMGALESAHWIESGESLDFSEQQLVDCVKTSFGCNGGNQSFAFRYLKKSAAMTESSYPYTALTQDCKWSSSNNTGVTSVSHTMVTPNSVSQFKAALTQQPLSVSIEADHRSFQAYQSGVYNDAAGCGTTLDHAVMAVGFGTDVVGGDYYLIRNSWGASWGEAGYIKFAVNGDGAGMCGVQMGPLYPTVNK